MNSKDDSLNKTIVTSLTMNKIDDLLYYLDFDVNHSYFSESTVKYEIFDENHRDEPFAEFYGVMDVSEGPYFFERTIRNEKLVGCFSMGDDPFSDFYYRMGNEILHFKDTNELYIFIETLQNSK